MSNERSKLKKPQRRLPHNRLETHSERMLARRMIQRARVSQAAYGSVKTLKAHFVLPFVYVSKYSPLIERLKHKEKNRVHR